MVSTLDGPIPPHPYYDNADPLSYLNMPQPRVRPEAENYARQGQGNGGILLHVEGQRPPSAFNSFKKSKLLIDNYLLQVHISIILVHVL